MFGKAIHWRKPAKFEPLSAIVLKQNCDDRDGARCLANHANRSILLVVGGQWSEKVRMMEAKDVREKALVTEGPVHPVVYIDK